MGADQILSRTRDLYQGCRTLVASGHGQCRGTRIIFTAHYVCPDRFRFSCSAPVQEEVDIILFNDKDTYYALCSKGDRSLEQLERRADAVATGSAISFGAINAVTELIFTDLLHPSTFGGKVISVTDAELGNFACHIIDSVYYTSSLRIWISKPDSIVRRIRRKIRTRIGAQSSRNSNEIESSIDFDSVTFNSSIDSDLFSPENCYV